MRGGKKFRLKSANLTLKPIELAHIKKGGDGQTSCATHGGGDTGTSVHVAC